MVKIGQKMANCQLLFQALHKEKHTPNCKLLNSHNITSSTLWNGSVEFSQVYPLGSTTTKLSQAQINPQHHGASTWSLKSSILLQWAISITRVFVTLSRYLRVL